MADLTRIPVRGVPLLLFATLFLACAGEPDVPVAIRVLGAEDSPGLGRFLRIEFRNRTNRSVRSIRFLVLARDGDGAPLDPAGREASVSARDRPFLRPGETRRDVYPATPGTAGADIRILETVFEP